MEKRVITSPGHETKPRGELIQRGMDSKSIYKLAYTLIEDIDINDEIFIRCHLEYLFDYLPLNKKVLIINYLLSNVKMTEYEVALIDYLEQFKLEKEGETYFLLED